MRRTIVALMMLFCLVTVSCKQQGDSMQSALHFRTKLTEAGGCGFTAAVEADYGEKLYQFALSCRYDGTDGFLTVTAPQEISGITAKVIGASSKLSFDGAVLEYGKLANGHVAPLAVPWLLGSAWKEDYISAACADGQTEIVTFLKGYNEEELTIQTGFVAGVPQFAEVSSGGKRVLTVTISDFSFGTQ